MVIVHVILGFTQGGVSSVVKNLLLAQAKANMRLAVVTKKEDCKTVRDWSETHNIQLSVYATKQRNVKHPSLTGYLDKNLNRTFSLDPLKDAFVLNADLELKGIGEEVKALDGYALDLALGVNYPARTLNLDLDANYKNGLIDLEIGLESILCGYCS